MRSVGDLFQRLRRGPTDVVGLDAGSRDVAAVRMRKVNGALVVAGVDLYPLKSRPDGTLPPLKLPSRMRAPFASLCTGGEAPVKMLTVQGEFDEAHESKLTAGLGIENPDDYRIGYKLLAEGHGKGETAVLCGAMRNADAERVLGLVPAGRPVPFSLEVSGLASLTAFWSLSGAEFKAQAVAAIDFGDDATYFAAFNRNSVSLVRRFETGTSAIVAKVQASLGVDADTAAGVLSDGAFDVSHIAADAFQAVLDRVIVSRDYVERRENCHIKTVFASGNVTMARTVLDQLRASVEVRNWDPFEGLKTEPGSIPEECSKVRGRFVGAVGACLATLEES